MFCDLQQFTKLFNKNICMNNNNEVLKTPCETSAAVKK